MKRLLLLICIAAPAASAQERVDLLIRGGQVIDGTGSTARLVDIGVRGDRIVYVGAASANVVATRTLDATGLVVAPGFIDPHTHTYADFMSANRALRQNAAYLFQGVTTVITGNDGGGPIDVAEHLARFARDSVGTNVGLLVGFGSVRSRILGASPTAATPAQIDQMRALVRTGMRGGAFGLSSGLFYAPQSFAKTDEVTALAKVAAEHNGYYDSHLRDESTYSIGLVAAVAEAIQIGRESRAHVHISHIKALGTEAWGKSDSVIALVRAARESGVGITADQYPFTASGTSLGASLLPRWAEAGGRDSLRRRVNDPAVRDTLLREMRRNLARRNGAAALLITGARDTSLQGRTLEEIARRRGQEPVIAALEIIVANDVGVASFNMHEGDIAKFMVEPWVLTGSDGSDGHPRKFATYPRMVEEYVRRRSVLSLERFVHRSTLAVAQALGIHQRGRIAVGDFADLILFDPASVRAEATYQMPTLPATGMRYVIVNGQLAVDQGKMTGALAGRALKRSL